MELSNSPMSERQLNYREIYRSRIATWYNGFLHVALIYLIGFGSIFVYASHIQQPTWLEWLMCTTTSLYLIYEFMHFCCHIDENWFVRHCPLANTLRRHHTAHHYRSSVVA